MKLIPFGFGCAAFLVMSISASQAAEKSWSVQGSEALEIDKTCARSVDVQSGDGIAAITVSAKAEHQEEIDLLRVGGRDGSLAVVGARRGQCWGGERTLSLSITVPTGVPVTRNDQRP